MEMKNIIIVLQRSELNYLIKYDTLRTSSDRIINLGYKEFKSLSEDNKVSLLQESLPIYEQDHEVLLIEYDYKLVTYDNAPTLEFKGISSIIPLTETGSRLLSAKLNIDFNILDYLDVNLYRSFINNRNHILRMGAGEKLCSFYDVPAPDEGFIVDFKNATLFQLNYNSPTRNDSALAHLIDFNTTPSFIPEGNIEALIKTACVGLKKLGLEVDKVTKSTFYTLAVEEKEVINDISLFRAIEYIEDKIEIDKNTKTRFIQLKETLSEKGKYKNAFLLFSYFYYLKKEMEKNDYDVSAPKNTILELKYNDLDTASKVLYMLGYTFSIQTISKSIQSFSNSQLLKTPKNLNLEWTPRVIEEEIVIETVIPIQGTTEDNFGVVKYQDGNSLENQTETEPEDLVNKIQDEKTFTKTWNSDKESEEKKVIENEKTEDASLTESKMYEEKEPSDNSSSLVSVQFSMENDFINSTSEDPVCDLKEFKKNIGNGKFADKIISAINNSNSGEEKISKQLIISCLKEIDEYETKGGKISSNTKKALKIFE